MMTKFATESRKGGDRRFFHRRRNRWIRRENGYVDSCRKTAAANATGGMTDDRDILLLTQVVRANTDTALALNGIGIAAQRAAAFQTAVGCRAVNGKCIGRRLLDCASGCRRIRVAACATASSKRDGDGAPRRQQ
jgi:hypothetical protein